MFKPLRLPPMRRRFLCAVALTWLVFTSAAIVLHWWVWIASPGADGAPSVVEGSWPKAASGLLQMVAIVGLGFVSKVLRLPPSQELGIAAVGYAIGFGAWAAVSLLLSEARRRWLAWKRCPDRPVDLSRRRILTDGSVTLAGLAGGSALGTSVLIEPWDLVRRAYAVPIRALPAALDGLRLVQLSDTHLGPRIPAWHIRRAVEMALAARPDLVLLTGDYIHNGARYIQHSAALFRPLLDAGLPCVGVLGNHDWYGDGPAMRNALAALGVTMIDNTRVFLGPDRCITSDPAPESLCMAGVGDLLEHTADLDAALAGVPADTPRLLLSHNPDAAELIGPHRRVDLMLAGHTHGGQVSLPLLGPPVVPSKYGQKYSGGLVTGPVCPVIISRGVGVSILPVRLGVPPEVVQITLVRA